MRFIPATILLCASVIVSLAASATPSAAQEVEWFTRSQAMAGGVTAAKVRRTRQVRQVRQVRRGQQVRQVRQARKSRGISMAGVVAPLASKVASIQSACAGTVVISAVRHTRIAGTRVISLHASGRAVDVSGNYRCIYGQLANWPGGYSIDSGRVQHIHISYGGREDGLRFAHGGGKRYAHRRHAGRKQYAIAR